MENFPKRGRPRKIPRPLTPELPETTRQVLGDALRSDRTHANAFYADSARDVAEVLAPQMQEALPHDPVLAAKVRRGMDWILARRTVLTELGRMMDDDPDSQDVEQDIARFHAVIMNIAERHDKLSAKAACAYIRGKRLGETKRRDRVAALHHDLNAAINVHRQRFPGSSWADVLKALELTEGQIRKKIR